MTNSVRLLFICSRNQWRSPTAEQVWRRHSGYQVRSAGTSPNAKRTVNAADISWADIIFVMETKHRSRLMSVYNRLLQHKPLHVLDIPDEYQYLDPELVAELEAKVAAVLEAEN